MQKIKFFLKDKGKKNFFRITFEVIGLWAKHREFPVHYFAKFLYRKEVTNIHDYLTTGQISKISFNKIFNKPEYSVFLQHKLTIALLCEEMGLPHPKLCFYNFGPRFFLNDESFMIKDIDTLKSFCIKAFDKFKVTSFFLKPISDYGGKGCFLITKENLNLKIKSCGKEILEKDYICQQVVEQHESINQINPSCINTIRMETYIDTKGQAHILSGFMRFGNGGSVVDNASSGGFYVGIDMEKGRLRNIGRQLIRYGGQRFIKHPQTNFEFGGFEIPFFEQACDLVMQMVSFVPDGLIGWDIAITPKGPVAIEGNTQPGLIVTDIAYGGLLKNPIMKEIVSLI